VPLVVEGKIYIAEFPRSGPLPKEVEWDSADGQHHTASANVPPGVATERCMKPPS
jgi:hypothetical protein